MNKNRSTHIISLIMIMTVQVFSGSDPRDRTSAYSSPSKHYRLCGTELPGVVSISCNTAHGRRDTCHITGQQLGQRYVRGYGIGLHRHQSRLPRQVKLLLTIS